MTWQRVARGIARLWIASILALGLPAQAQAQDASPSVEPTTALLPQATQSSDPFRSCSTFTFSNLNLMTDSTSDFRLLCVGG